MDPLVREISRQVSKIVRILTKVSEQHPQISRDVDLALYAAIKIEKGIGKYAGLNCSSELMDEDGAREGWGRASCSDPMLDAAWANIEGFRESTAKLQSKINILVNESETVAKRQHFHPSQESVHYKNHNAKPIKIHKKRLAVPQSQNDNSRSLSQIDQSILKLSYQITNLAGQERSKKQSRNESQVEEYER